MRTAGPGAAMGKAVGPLLEAGVEEGVFPGVVVHVRREGRVGLHAAYGSAQVTPARRSMTPDTIFDLASLTKPVATATAVLQLVERGVLELDAAVASCLPAFGQAGKEDVTLRHLLTHTSGLPAWIRLYLHTSSAVEALEYICRHPVTEAPGTRFEYSDLGFIILGEIVRGRGGMPLDQYVAAHVAPPLRWEWTRFTPPAVWRRRCAATEEGNGYERAAAGGEGDGFPWRTHVLVGEVHDGNSHYSFGGVAGHAGLFGTAEEIGRFGQAMLNGGQAEGGRVLQAGTVAEATRDQIGDRLGVGVGLGWRCRLGSSSMGTRASAQAFGHTGFTGASVLIDPARELVVVLLTNRVHPRADSAAIETFRGRFHDAVFAAVD